MTSEQVVRAKARYEELKKKGLCTQCRKPAQPHRVLCEECANKATRQGTTAYYRLKEQGLCPLCRGPARLGRVYCKKCQVLRTQRRTQQMWPKRARTHKFIDRYKRIFGCQVRGCSERNPARLHLHAPHGHTKKKPYSISDIADVKEAIREDNLVIVCIQHHRQIHTDRILRSRGSLSLALKGERLMPFEKLFVLMRWGDGNIHLYHEDSLHGNDVDIVLDATHPCANGKRVDIVRFLRNLVLEHEEETYNSLDVS